MTATETDSIAHRLAEVEAQIAGLTSHREPRVLAKRLLDLLDRMDALRVELGSYIRCARCREAFAPPRADARYCSSACRQAAHRRRRVTDKPQRVTALAAREPRCGVSRPDGQQPASAPQRPRAGKGAGVGAPAGRMQVRDYQQR